MTNQESCPECGKPLPKGAPMGLCPACLIAQGLRDETPSPTGGGVDDESLLPLEDTSDRYTFLGEEGRGGMGRVLLVHDERLGRDIALKELLPAGPPEGEATPTPVRHSKEMAGRFLREAKITGQLEHPSITPVHEIGRRKDGTLYYTMKLVRGRTLEAAIEKAGNLEERLKLLPHFVDLCQAIAYAHSCKVIHRDIKPPNVMVGDFGETVIVDWGLAKVKDKESPAADTTAKTILSVQPDVVDDDSIETAYGQVMGTLAYTPPEQAEGEIDKIDERSDVYSLGAVFYEILTGKPPHSGSTRADLVRQVVMEDPEAIQSIESGVPDELVAICTKAIQKKPEKRYQTAGELASEVQHFLSGALVGAYHYNFTHHLRRFVRQYKLPLATAAAALLAVLATGAVSYFNVLQARDNAEIARDDAQQSAESERVARSDAEEAAEGERVARAEAEEQREKAEYGEAIANIKVAQVRLDENSSTTTRAILDEIPERFRNWEWGHLLYEASGNLRVSGDELVIREPKPGQTTADLWDDASASIVWVKEVAQGSGTVRARYSANGSLLFTSGGGEAAIWDLAANEKVCSFAARGWARPSPDFTLVASMDNDGTTIIWDGVTGDKIRTIPSDIGDPRNFWFSDDASLLAMSSTGRVDVWEVATAKQVAMIPVEGRTSFSEITYLSFVENDSKVILVAGGNRIETWTWDDDGNPERVDYKTGPRPEEGFYTSSVSPDLKVVISAKTPSGIVTTPAYMAWKLETEGELWELPPRPVPSAYGGFSTDSTCKVTPLYDGSVEILDSLRAGRNLAVFTGISDALYTAEFSPDGTRVVVGDVSGGRVRILAPADIAPTLGHSDTVYQALFSPDGERIATASHDHTVILWDARTLRPLRKLEGHEAEIWRICFSPDGARLLTEGWDQKTILWDTENGMQLKEFSGGPPRIDYLGGPRAVAAQLYSRNAVQNRFSADGSRFLVASPDGDVLVINADSYGVVNRFSHTDYCFNALYGSDGTRIATSVWGQAPQLWDAQTGTELDFGAEVLWFPSPDGARTAHIMNLRSESVVIRDFRTGAELHTLSDFDYALFHANFDAQNKRIAFYGWSAELVDVRDAESGARVAELRGHRGALGAKFSPDGTRILTQEFTGRTIRVWDLPEGNEVWSVQTENIPFYATWSPDGNSILVCEGNDIHLYRSIPWPELAQLGDEDTSLENRVSLWDKARREQ